MDILDPAPHTVLYPGIDRFKCGKCGKWICTSGEIERLKRRKDETKNKKRYAELHQEIKLEEHNMKHCA